MFQIVNIHELPIKKAFKTNLTFFKDTTILLERDEVLKHSFGFIHNIWA